MCTRFTVCSSKCSTTASSIMIQEPPSNIHWGYNKLVESGRENEKGEWGILVPFLLIQLLILFSKRNPQER